MATRLMRIRSEKQPIRLDGGPLEHRRDYRQSQLRTPSTKLGSNQRTGDDRRRAQSLESLSVSCGRGVQVPDAFVHAAPSEE